MRLLLRLGINAAALWLATRVIDGISWQGPWYGLLAVALVFGVVNAIIRPLFKLFTFPFLILTLGLFTFVTNALMLWLTSVVAQRLGFQFTVGMFGPALWGALLVSITSGVLSFVLIDDDEDDDD
jgi:putative membrane protein